MKKDKSKKKNSFYNNKNRNQKWTEEPKGRPIEFADKYDNPDANDSLNNASVKRRTAAIKAEKKKNQLHRAISAIVCIVFVCVGYVGMQVHIDRNATPVRNHNQYQTADSGNISNVSLDIQSLKVESISLDGSVMLSSVINEVENLGFSSITFDAKREDGSIGYNSSLASVDTFNAITSPATDLKGSVSQLLEHDILPIARICCYKDNVMPAVTTDATVMTETGVYTDSDGNTYLNPNSTTTYNYIKDIITECYDNGVTVFVLYGCDLPSDIADDFNDGYYNLASKLNHDLDAKIRLYEAVDISVKDNNPEESTTADDEDEDENTTEQSTTEEFTEVYTTEQTTEEGESTTSDSDLGNLEPIDSNKVYYIKTKADRNQTIERLAENGITSYILED